jgi:hypothetical protein
MAGLLHVKRPLFHLVSVELAYQKRKKLSFQITVVLVPDLLFIVLSFPVLQADP